MTTRISKSAGLRAKSVQEFVQIVCEIRDQWIEGGKYFDPWFRGQRKASRKLIPNIFRYKLFNEEDQIRSEFLRRAAQYVTEQPPNDYWGWYFLMQHYGAPTRLLDWTDSALVALFFALNRESPSPYGEGEEDEEDSVVWVLNPWWLNQQALNDDAILLPSSPRAAPYLREPFEHLDSDRNTSIEPSLPAAIDPPFIARRVAVQRSHFTIFGSEADGLLRFADAPNTRLIPIRLAKEKAVRMRADLLTLGLSDTSIYPDLRGLSFELIRYYQEGWPPD
jgi:FRG domain